MDMLIVLKRLLTNVNTKGKNGKIVTKKERPETTTGPLLSLSDPDLLHTYRPSIFLTLGLSTDSRICTLRVINTQHITTEQTTHDSISSLPSLTRTDTSQKHPCYITDYLHSESTSSFFRQVHKTPDLPVIVQSLSPSPNFCSNDLTRTTRRSGENLAFSQDRPTIDLSPLCPSEFCLFLLYRSIDPHQDHPPTLPLTV